MSERAASRGVKRLTIGSRVSGTFGELIPNPDPSKKRCIRKRLVGNVVCAVGHGKYTIAFDNGITMDCCSNRLRAESSHDSIPPDIPPPQANVPPPAHPPRAQAELDAEEEAIVEATEDSHEDDEHMPPSLENQAREEEDGEGGEGWGEGMGQDMNVQDDPDGRMPGQLGGAEHQEEPASYAQRKERAKEHIRRMIGQEVTIRQRDDQIKWKVVAESVAFVEGDSEIGLQGLELSELDQNVVVGELFLHVAFPDWRTKLAKMNDAIRKQNDDSNNNSAKVRPFTQPEFLVALGLLVGAVEYGCKGGNLWLNGKKVAESDWSSILPHPNFDRFMLEYRFKNFRHFLPYIFADESLRDADDPWWKFAGAVKEFNDHRSNIIKPSKTKVADESMSAYRPRTTATGGLPNISFVKWKPEPLGKVISLLVCFILLLCYSHMS